MPLAAEEEQRFAFGERPQADVGRGQREGDALHGLQLAEEVAEATLVDGHHVV